MTKNIKLSLSILLLLILVFSSAYSYFSLRISTDGYLAVNIVPDVVEQTFAYSFDQNMVYDVNPALFSGGFASNTPVIENSSNLVITVAPDDEKNIECSFDIMFAWTSEDVYTTSSVPFPYVAENANEYVGQFTIQIQDFMPETDLSSFTFYNNYAKLVDDARIVSENGNLATKSVLVTNRLYNMPFNQTDLIGKQLSANVYLDDVSCSYYSPSMTSLVLAPGDTIVDGLNKNVGMVFITSNKDSRWEIQQTSSRLYVAGKNPDNFVCFQHDGDTCDIEKLYRISGSANISYDVDDDGVFDEYTDLAMIVKHTPFTDNTIAWDEDDTNHYWPDSSLYNYIISDLYNPMTDYQKQMIASADWEYPRTSTSYAETPVKVGLLFHDNYNYGTLEDLCYATYSDSTAACKKNNWLLLHYNNAWGFYRDRITDYVLYSGFYLTTDLNSKRYAYPAFYLKPSTYIVSGTGTYEDPYYLGV